MVHTYNIHRCLSYTYMCCPHIRYMNVYDSPCNIGYTTVLDFVAEVTREGDVACQKNFAKGLV